jgi:hypothetical protein
MQCPEFLGVKMAKEPAYVDLKKTIVRDSQGRRITDAYIRKSMKEIEPILQQLYAGRPSLSEEGVTSPRVSVRLPVKLHKLAKQKAKQKGLSLSDLTRLALEKYLKAS